MLHFRIGRLLLLHLQAETPVHHVAHIQIGMAEGCRIGVVPGLHAGQHRCVREGSADAFHAEAIGCIGQTGREKQAIEFEHAALHRNVVHRFRIVPSVVPLRLLQRDFKPARRVGRDPGDRRCRIIKRPQLAKNNRRTAVYLLIGHGAYVRLDIGNNPRLEVHAVHRTGTRLHHEIVHGLVLFAHTVLPRPFVDHKREGVRRDARHPHVARAGIRAGCRPHDHHRVFIGSF